MKRGDEYTLKKNVRLTIENPDGGLMGFEVFDGKDFIVAICKKELKKLATINAADSSLSFRKPLRLLYVGERFFFPIFMTTPLCESIFTIQPLFKKTCRYLDGMSMDSGGGRYTGIRLSKTGVRKYLKRVNKKEETK